MNPNGEKERNTGPADQASWGPKLFLVAFIAALVFFWWLLIYSHGVAPHGA